MSFISHPPPPSPSALSSPTQESETTRALRREISRLRSENDRLRVELQLQAQAQAQAQVQQLNQEGVSGEAGGDYFGIRSSGSDESSGSSTRTLSEMELLMREMRFLRGDIEGFRRWCCRRDELKGDIEKENELRGDVNGAAE